MNAEQRGNAGLRVFPLLNVKPEKPEKVGRLHTLFKAILPHIANAIIATFRLRRCCDYRIMPLMQRLTDKAMADLGGTTEVATLLKAPVSTVHSWKRNGISDSRLDHLKLAAQAAGKHIDWSTALEEIAPDGERAAA